MAMTEDGIEHYEKYNVAFHEIGHVHMLRRFGGCADAKIWRNLSSNIHNDEKTWLGTTKVYAWPRQVNIGVGIAVHPVPPNWEVLVGLAGLEVEYMHHGEECATEIAYYIEDNCDYDEISESDRRLIGDNWTESDVQEVMDIFTEEWHVINESVERLIFSSR